MKTKNLFIIALFVALLCPSVLFAQTYTLVPMTNPDADLNGLKVVWSYDNNNIFAGGNNGTLLKYNGSAWTQVANPFSEQIVSIYGASPVDIWMVTYEGSLLYYNGSTVVKITTGNLNHLSKVVGFSANDIYFAGEFGTLYHYDGANWSQISNSYGNFAFYGISGNNSNDLYLIGRDQYAPYTARMFHYDGVNLVEVFSGAYSFIGFNVYSPDNNLFYIGGGGLYRFNKTSGAVDQIFDGSNVVYGFSANNILVAKNNGQFSDSLVIFNGSTWKSYQQSWGNSIQSICSPYNNPNNVFLVGDYGTILHLDLTTGIEESTFAPSTFNIYPNPASDQITIDLVFDKKINTKIELFDLVGKQVKLISEFVGNESKNTIDISDLPSGSYFVKVTTEGNGIFTKKLVITK